MRDGTSPQTIKAKTCWEVEKTCERGAVSREAYLSRQNGLALNGKRTLEDVRIPPLYVWRKYPVVG
jgi:hypothetical protein